MNPSIKRICLFLAIGTVLLVAGFASGRFYQHAQTGFHSKVIAEEDYGTSEHPVRLRYVSESVGMPFLDPGTTIIEYRGRTIYKAQRLFQESFPVAANIRAEGNRIHWDDGEFKFHLTVEEMKKGDRALGAK